MLKKLIIKYLYIIICKIYQNIVGYYEYLFLKDRKTDRIFKKLGIFNIKHINIDISDFTLNANKNQINKYSYLRILEEKQINELINKIFTNETKEIITEKTGYKYSIDYLIFYDREHIKEYDLNTGNGALSVLNQWYAYEWHFDKPNSTNMLKIILPITIFDEESALSVIDRKKSRSIKPNLVDSSLLDKTYFKGNLNNIYGFNPTVCIHRDGIPPKGTTATQIMFQLNPSKNWLLNKEIYKKQMKREPKFPLISYLRDKKERI